MYASSTVSLETTELRVCKCINVGQHFPIHIDQHSTLLYLPILLLTEPITCNNAHQMLQASQKTSARLI